MLNYQNILLTVDFSEHDQLVVQRASALAEQFHATLHILHVLDNIPMPDTPYGTVVPLTEDSAYELLEQEKNKLVKISNQLNIAPSRRWLIWGEPQQEITQLAIQQQIDLIIVGSHGRHGFAVLMGSTAKDVLYHAECDVLAVHIKEPI
ncbi:universal stress protein [Nitrosomonas sp.]|uniref:universal stress protein n=1 Tax=Nitrosomonas sp. TaxID=42353 RepID=UPI001DE2A337|nr:universal stress protein [Nitrosomonas sp.]MBX3616514.1 universal stress protein [Nitrosomonas sp.]